MKLFHKAIDVDLNAHIVTRCYILIAGLLVGGKHIYVLHFTTFGVCFHPGSLQLPFCSEKTCHCCMLAQFSMEVQRLSHEPSSHGMALSTPDYGRPLFVLSPPCHFSPGGSISRRYFSDRCQYNSSSITCINLPSWVSGVLFSARKFHPSLICSAQKRHKWMIFILMQGARNEPRSPPDFQLTIFFKLKQPSSPPASCNTVTTVLLLLRIQLRTTLVLSLETNKTFILLVLSPETNISIVPSAVSVLWAWLCSVCHSSMYVDMFLISITSLWYVAETSTSSRLLLTYCSE